jgi:integrase
MASIKRRPDGAWRARYRDAERREHARHFGRKVDAQRWLDEVTAAVVTGQYVDPRAGQVTMAAFYAGFAERQVWEAGTRAAMDLAMRSCDFADTPIGALRRSHVEAWVKAMTVRGLAPGTIATRVGNVRAVLRAAVRDRVITADPCEGVVLPRRRRTAAAMTIPTPAEVGQLMAACDDVFRAGVALAAFAGLRLGEVCGAQVGDIGFLTRTLDVRRQVQRNGGRDVEVRPPKYGSERAVFIPDDLVTLLAQHVEQLPGTSPGRWLFPGEDGIRPLHQNSAGYHWRRARGAAGLPTARFHHMRHFYASGLIAAGCDVVTVQRALGHRSAAVTLNTYAHLWVTAEDRTRGAAADLMLSARASADSLRTKEG